MTVEKIELGGGCLTTAASRWMVPFRVRRVTNPNGRSPTNSCFPTMKEQVLKPVEDPNEMELSLAEASVRVGLDSETTTGGLATYIRFVHGDRAAFSPPQQLGFQIFRDKVNWTARHAGPNCSDEAPHNSGVAWRDGKLSDEGEG